MSEHRHHGAWAVWINDSDRDHNGAPFRLDVRPSNGGHVTEEDAEWLREVIRDALARQRRASGTYTPSFGSLVRLVTEASGDNRDSDA